MRTSSKGRRRRTADAWCLAVLVALGARTAAAETSVECAPACGAGETCVNGVCMVPVKPPAAKPPADQPPPEQPAPAASPPEAAPPAPATPPAPPHESVAAQQTADVQPPKKAPRPAPVASASRAPSSPQYAGVPALPDRERRGTLILPYVGLHSFQDSNDTGADPGFRVGTFVGRYVNEIWSLNGQAELDVFNPNDKVAAAGLDVSMQMLGVTFSPLVHIGNVKAEFVAGPKLGGWIQRKHMSAGTSSLDGTLEGWTLGANAGVFVAVSPSVLVGGMLSLEVRDILHGCASGTNIPETCTSNGNGATLLGFTFGLLL